MDEKALPASGETPEEHQRWIIGLCMDMAFARTQVPYEVIAAVRELAEWYGIEAGIEAAYAVLSAFDAGRCGTGLTMGATSGTL